MNKSIIIGIIAVILIAGGIYWFVQSQNNGGAMLPGAANAPSPTPETVPATNPSPAPTTGNPSPAPVSTPPPAATSMPVTHSVTIQSFAFSPASLTIKKGDTVIWTNRDPMGHTITGNNGGPASPTINTNGTYSFTFNNAGTFGYHCSIHPSMVGTVVVTQ